MTELRAFTPEDAKEVASWLDDERIFNLWSAGRYENFPITASDILAYYKNEKAMLTPFSIYDGGKAVGHFALRFPYKDGESAKICFIVIDKKMRGMGYGKELVQHGVNKAFDVFGVKRVALGVFENNETAMKCYRSCGFVPVVPEVSESYGYKGETWKMIEMETTAAR